MEYALLLSHASRLLLGALRRSDARDKHGTQQRIDAKSSLDFKGSKV